MKDRLSSVLDVSSLCLLMQTWSALPSLRTQDGRKVLSWGGSFYPAVIWSAWRSSKVDLRFEMGWTTRNWTIRNRWPSWILSGIWLARMSLIGICRSICQDDSKSIRPGRWGLMLTPGNKVTHTHRKIPIYAPNSEPNIVQVRPNIPLLWRSPSLYLSTPLKLPGTP